MLCSAVPTAFGIGTSFCLSHSDRTVSIKQISKVGVGVAGNTRDGCALVNVDFSFHLFIRRNKCTIGIGFLEQLTVCP